MFIVSIVAVNALNLVYVCKTDAAKEAEKAAVKTSENEMINEPLIIKSESTATNTIK